MGTLNAKPGFSNSSGLKSVFQKLLSLGRILWTVQIKLYFRISPARCGPGHSRKNAALEAIFLIETAACTTQTFSST